jgi:lantibiotic leader peptide-processing serine protease
LLFRGVKSMKFKKAFALMSTLVMMVSMMGVFPAAAASLPYASTGVTQTYVVLYKKNAVPSTAASTVSKAGGTLIYSYKQIGVLIASSDNALFTANLLKDSNVQGAAATTRFATQLDLGTSDDNAEAPTPGTPAPGSDNLSSLQWDMDQIHAPEARAINGGSSSVLVGDIDTGLDYTHPDLAPNVDDANSVNCVSGVPVPGKVAADDDNGHGTHTAGTIAAAKNTVGIVGVAPNVKIAGIKAGNADGFFFPEAVVCAFMWAGSHHFQVTNNSYFADPWLFNCRNDPEQRAIWNAERRAIQYAISQGVVVVAAEGNQSDDLAHPTQDITSPDDTTPVTREITNACAVVPVEVPGVIGVTANGNKQFKSYYSSYGVGSADVIAPGGDRRFQVTSAATNGRVLSTYPAKFFAPSPLIIQDCSVSPCAVYAYLQGTSMASPHAAGVAALIMSTGVNSPGAVAAKLQNTADKIACPTDMSVYAGFPAVDNGAPQVCQGDLDYNSFNGHGQVNALTAVSP